MKKYFKRINKSNIFFAIIFAGTLLASCNSENNDNSYSSSEQVNPLGPISIEEDSITKDFILTDEGGKRIPLKDGNYHIEASGKYVASGKLVERQIIVDVPYGNAVIDLEGVSMANSTYSPIYVKTISKIKINVSVETSNYFYDNRLFAYSRKDSNQGLGAISVIEGNLELTGKGALEIASKNNSGIYSKGDIDLKTRTILIDAYENGIISDGSIVIDNNPSIDIRSGQDGIKTSYYYVDIDKHKYGDIQVHNGSILINSNEDALDAAHSIMVGNASADMSSLFITCLTGKYSRYYDKFLDNTNITSSSKGFKAKEEIVVNNGNMFLRTFDDSIHSDSKQIVELVYSISPNGNISIYGGNLTLYSIDDAIHADGDFVITDGSIDVLASHEGLEADSILVNGGYIKVIPVDYLCDEYAQVTIQTDDAINAHKSIIINGGVVDASSNPDKEVDTIDSNGIFLMNGGTVIVRGPSGNDSGAIECTGDISVLDGNLLCSGSIISTIGETSIPLNRKHIPLNGKGDHVFMIESTTYSYMNKYDYENTFIYSNNSIITVH